MKMKMKKKMIAGVVSAAMLLVPASCYAEVTTASQAAEASEATASDVLTKMAENMNNAKSLTADIELGAKLSNEGSGENIDSSLSLSLGLVKDPAALRLAADLSALDTGIDNLEAYLNTDEAGALNLYANLMGQWVAFRADLSMFGIEDINTALESVIPAEFEVNAADWKVEEKGGSYEVSRMVSLSEYPETMDMIMQQVQGKNIGNIDEAALPTVEKIVNAAKMNIQLAINNDTYALENIHMDLNDSDVDALNAIDENTKVVIENIYMDIAVGADTAGEIKVPEEAMEVQPIDALQLITSFIEQQ